MNNLLTSKAISFKEQSRFPANHSWYILTIPQAK